MQLTSDMEFEHTYRYGPHASIGYPLQQYQHDGRDMAFAVPTGGRMNRRVCPVRGPAMRLQVRGDDNETGQSRRRVAVAVSHAISALPLP